MAETIDLTTSSEPETNNLLTRREIGEFVDGTVKMTQSSADVFDPLKISFDEVFQAEGMKKCVLTSFVIDEKWLGAKLEKIPRAILCIDDNERLSTGAHRHSNIIVVYPPFPKFPNYGVMHCKLMLLWYEDFLRVVISSGNLVPYDYDEIQNILFIQDLPRFKSNYTEAVEFRDNMIKLLGALGVNHDLVSSEEMLQYDWSRVKVKLVFSLPGMQLTTQEATGLCMLQRCVERCSEPLILECQGSSLGSIDEEWLRDVVCCASGQLPDRSLVSQKPSLSKVADRPENNVRLVFPTLQYVLTSPMGPEGFGTIFCRMENWSKVSYPRQSFHKCESVFGNGQALHTKIITAMGLNNAKRWWYVGSANFTSSAWGKFVKGKSKFLVANYELGIVFTAEDAQVLCPNGFPFPYRRPLSPYTDKDFPWIQSRDFYQ